VDPGDGLPVDLCPDRGRQPVQHGEPGNSNDCATSIHGSRAVDCGPLDTSGVRERITALLVGVNRRCKTHAGIRLTGLPVTLANSSLGRPA
jgi:hypothetical protein